MALFKGKVRGADLDRLTKKLRDLKSPVNTTDLNKMGKATVKEMLRLIAKGEFPIAGGGYRKKFAKYKRGHKKDGYPNTVKNQYPNKKVSPVNLKLSGDFLDDLGFSVSRNQITIGYSDKEQIEKEKGHRKGTNSQPKRPTIPLASRRENFTQSVREKYLSVLLDKIEKITKRKN